MKKKYFFSKLNSLTAYMLVLLVLLTACARHEKKGEEIIREYESQDGVLTLKIPPGLIGMFLSGEKTQDTKDAFSEMESIKLILVDMSKVRFEDIPDFTLDFEDKLILSGFESFFMFNEAGSKVHILTLEEEESIQELMVLVSGEGEFLGICLTGKIDPDQFVDIAREIKISDFQFD